MKYRRLGKSGLQVSELSLGSWLTFGKQIDENVAKSCMYAAYDAGVNFFDNAEVYAKGQSEIVMGTILQESGWGRDTFVVSSKVFWGGDKPNQKGLSRKHIIEACHGALRRLRVEYLDLYFCHRPDRSTPIEETVRAMNELIWQGKILYWGTSEWSAQEIQAAIGVARQYNLIPPTMEQPQYNMFHRQVFESEYLRLFQDEGIGSTIWSPLASGLLTGKYLHGNIPTHSRGDLAAHTQGMGWLYERLVGDDAQSKMPKIEALKQLADEVGCSLAQLALAWCLKNPHVSSVIMGASRPEQVQENIKTLDFVDILTPAIMLRIEDILQNKPTITVF